MGRACSFQKTWQEHEAAAHFIVKIERQRERRKEVAERAERGRVRWRDGERGREGERWRKGERE